MCIYSLFLCPQVSKKNKLINKPMKVYLKCQLKDVFVCVEQLFLKEKLYHFHFSFVKNSFIYKPSSVHFSCQTQSLLKDIQHKQGKTHNNIKRFPLFIGDSYTNASIGKTGITQLKLGFDNSIKAPSTIVLKSS